MAYYDVALLATNNDFAQRCQACFAVEDTDHDDDPAVWWSAHAWHMAAQPGFGDAYASALVSDSANPGRDQAVISDGQILAAVQTLDPKGTPND